jgi:AcrR family transcriptional regulator
MRDADAVGGYQNGGRRERSHQDVSAQPVPEQIRRYLGEMAEISTASREKGVVLTGAGNRYGGLFLEPSVKTELARLIKRGKDTGEIRPDLDAVLVGAILAAAYLATLQRWISTEPPPFNLRDQLDGMLDILLRGLLADPAG